MTASVIKLGLVALLTVALGGCGIGSGTADGGTVSGTVVGWPAFPQGGQTRPAADAQLTFTTDQPATKVVSTRTAADGSFQASLPAGRFQVHVSAFGQADVVILRANDQDTKTAPAVYVTVVSGQRSRLDLRVATGIQ
jgi:hypothetical protein